MATIRFLDDPDESQPWYASPTQTPTVNGRTQPSQGWRPAGFAQGRPTGQPTGMPENPWQTFGAQPTSLWPSAPNPTAPLGTADPRRGTLRGGRFLEAYQREAARRQRPPAPAQTTAATGGGAFGGGDFREWFMNQIAGKPFNQQTLLDLEELLTQSGSKLTPANAQGERTKIWDPVKKDWVRVGFGEGAPVWVYQGWGENGPQTGGGGGGYPSQYSDEATKALEAFLKQRVSSLQQPAYTGAEWETFRTAALDPIEADRQAAQQRALENIGSRGFDPTSGIAQELINQVDAGFDVSRAKTQNQLAYNRIAEQRAREQEAQQLLTLLYDLPNQSLQQALAALGMSPNPASLFSQGMQYYNAQQANNLPWWQALGSLLPALGNLGR